MIWAWICTIFWCEFNGDVHFTIGLTRYGNFSKYGGIYMFPAPFFERNSTVTLIMSSEQYIVVIYDMSISSFSIWFQFKSWVSTLYDVGSIHLKSCCKIVQVHAYIMYDHNILFGLHNQCYCWILLEKWYRFMLISCMTTIYHLDYIINVTVEFPSKNGAGNT